MNIYKTYTFKKNTILFFTYPSRGKEIKGYSIIPQKEIRGVVVYFRGGCGYVGLVDERIIERKLSRFAELGYAVIGSNLVEQDNTYLDTVGGETPLDYLALLSLFPHFQDKKIHFHGGSRAAVDMLPLLEQLDWAPESVSIGNSWYCLDDLFNFRPRMKSVYQQYFNTDDEDEREERNLYTCALCPTRFFLYTNRDDDRVESFSTDRFYEHLIKNNFQVELRVFEEGGHGYFPLEMIVDFMEERGGFGLNSD